MKFYITYIFLFVFLSATVKGDVIFQNFDKQHFYAVMASGKIDEVKDELDLVASAPEREREAYEGALLIRKAGLVKLPSEKLKLFKKGRIKLETAIINDNKNAEFRFLRMSIEEHAPKIVKYNADIETDKEIVKRSFKNLSPVVQQAIIDYSKNSKVLHSQDL